MSYQALPLLFINLGGEMVYILHQRLNAQSIDAAKSQKVYGCDYTNEESLISPADLVLNDIIGTMYNKRFMDEIFKPQELHSKKAMRTVFDRLAHASIMRLNAASMDKLYDLMTMAVKYQVCLITKPKDLLLVTLNHLDGLRRMVSTQPAVLSTLDYLYDCVIQTYGTMSDGQLQLVRDSMLAFFQDMHVRVSIFLKERQQNQNGRFILPSGGAVPAGSKPPGTITLYGKDGGIRQQKKFNPGTNYADPLPEGSLKLTGDRVTKLGTNMYSATKPADTITSTGSSKPTVQAENIVPDPAAKAQLDLLSHLIGGGSGSSAKQSNFRLNLFNTDEEEQKYVSPVSQMEKEVTINIDASNRSKDKYLSKVMGEMSVGASAADDDLLDLMDKA